ncbi:unnamed protein product [Arctogadus glacialis]
MQKDHSVSVPFGSLNARAASARAVVPGRPRALQQQMVEYTGCAGGEPGNSLQAISLGLPAPYALANASDSSRSCAAAVSPAPPQLKPPRFSAPAHLVPNYRITCPTQERIVFLRIYESSSHSNQGFSFSCI